MESPIPTPEFNPVLVRERLKKFILDPEEIWEGWVLDMMGPLDQEPEDAVTLAAEYRFKESEGERDRL